MLAYAGVCIWLWEKSLAASKEEAVISLLKIRARNTRSQVTACFYVIT